MENETKQFFIEIIGTIIGALIMASAVSFFLLPNELSSGGFSGIATILYYKFKIPMGVTIASLNIPLFLMAGYKIGKQFFVKSVIGTISLSIFIDFFRLLKNCISISVSPVYLEKTISTFAESCPKRIISPSFDVRKDLPMDAIYMDSKRFVFPWALLPRIMFTFSLNFKSRIS